MHGKYSKDDLILKVELHERRQPRQELILKGCVNEITREEAALLSEPRLPVPAFGRCQLHNDRGDGQRDWNRVSEDHLAAVPRAAALVATETGY